ncbi:MAG: hypothetical protein LH702_29755 [Phormidesmis sp. CAN_BIN44]|nr:hypothetical protein [Phormidesmis sp. CAN_BIN44]
MSINCHCHTGKSDLLTANTVGNQTEIAPLKPLNHQPAIAHDFNKPSEIVSQNCLITDMRSLRTLGKPKCDRLLCF